MATSYPFIFFLVPQLSVASKQLLQGKTCGVLGVFAKGTIELIVGKN